MELVDEIEMPAASLARFRTAFDTGDLAAAERIAATLLDEPPGRAPDAAIDVLARLGLMRRRAGQREAAIEAFQRARDVGAAIRRSVPDWLPSELSGCLMERRDWPRALEAAEAGLGTKPVLGLTAATALMHLGRNEAARTRLRHTAHALGPDPSRAPLLATTCLGLLAADEGARTVVAEAAALHPGAPAFAELRATLAVLDQDWARGRLLFAEAFGTAPPLPALARLAALLRRAPDRREAFAPLFEAGVLAHPDSEAALTQWREMLSATLAHAEITERFAALQHGAARPLPALLLQLARRMPFATLRRRFAPQIEAWHQAPDVLACAALLDALGRLAEPEPGLAAAMLAMPELRLRLFLLLRRDPLHPIQVRGNADTLDAAGIDRQWAERAIDALMPPLAPAWAAYLSNAAFASPDAAQIVRHDEAFTAFQDRIVLDRAFHLTDPGTGAPADLFDSVKIHDRQVFAFAAAGELLLVHTGGNMNFVIGIHLVRRNILLTVDRRDAPSKQSFYASDIYMAEVMAVWLRRAARNVPALLQSAAAAPAARDIPRRIVAIHGRAENPAHHVWNYLPPFERLAMAGLLGHLAALVPPPTHYFGPVPGLFPELAGIDSHPLDEAAAIDPCPFSTTAIALQLGASFVPATLMDRIRSWAARAAPPGTRAEIAGLAGRPIVWIGLRVGDKAWVDQIAGMAAIIDHVVPLYPDALFVLDGFSLPDDAGAPTPKWQDAVQALQDAAAAIRAATAYPDAVRSLVGNRLSESVLWAEATSAYLAPMGSSQHKVGWYGSAPGIVYASPNVTKTPAARRQGAWEAEGSPMPHFLIGTIAAPGLRRSEYDFRTNLDNIAFPAHVAARRLLAILGAAELAGPAAARSTPPS